MDVTIDDRPGRKGQGRRRAMETMSSVDEAVAAIARGGARRHPDRHRLRPCVPAGQRGVRSCALRASRGARASSRSLSSPASVDALLELVPELAMPRARGASGPVHARAAEPCAPPAVARRRAAAHDRRPRARGERLGGGAARACRRGRGDEREPPRRPGSASSLGRARRDPRPGRRFSGRRRASGNAVDRARPDRARAARSPRRRGYRGRGSRTRSAK